jgi:hypothetical protein
MHGFYHGLHYFIGRTAPKSWNWPLPNQPPSRFEHFISFYNGAGVHLISQDIVGDGRGLNLDYIRSDESALLDKHKLDTTVIPTLRGTHAKNFLKSPHWGSIRHSTTMPLTAGGRWILEMEDPNIYDQRTTKVIKANCLVNLHNLMPGYLEARKQETTPWIFEAEYMNVRPRQVEGGFYAMLDERKHGYSSFNYNYYSAAKTSGNTRGGHPTRHRQAQSSL